jgi:hypothetical protein
MISSLLRTPLELKVLSLKQNGDSGITTLQASLNSITASNGVNVELQIDLRDFPALLSVLYTSFSCSLLSPAFHRSFRNCGKF